MNTPNPEPLPDPFEVEISALSADEGAEPEERQPPGRLASQASLSPRARARRGALVASAFLVLLVVILGSLPNVRSQVVDAVQRLIPTPTPTLAPGADRFYIATDVPWSKVALDGRPIALPRIGMDAPLRLARGRHMLTWTAAPFQPQQCSLDVPYTTATSCRLIDEARRGTAKPAFAVIGLPESLDTLPAVQQRALLQAAQTALSDFSDIIQPGEPYLIDSSGNVFGNGIARQPLRATLQLQLDTEIPTVTCSLNLRSELTSSCVISGQNCARFCAVPWQARQAATTAADRLEWLAFAVIYPPLWNYATEDGATITQNQPVCSCGAASRESPVLLHMAWDGSSWHVQPLFGPNQGPSIVVNGVQAANTAVDIQVADDPACLAAEDIFPEERQTYAQLRFISGPNPAAGCLLEATLVTPEGTPTAAAPVEEYLMRFGEFVAVNNLAHQRNPQWPQANAYEQQLARQLAALPGGLVVTPL